MLKALYDFQAVYPKTISFDEGEYFILYQTSARQRNWWQVVSMKGNIGFVPSNYVMKIKVSVSPTHCTSAPLGLLHRIELRIYLFLHRWNMTFSLVSSTHRLSRWRSVRIRKSMESCPRMNYSIDCARRSTPWNGYMQ